MNRGHATNADLLADLQVVYQELGYLSLFQYKVLGTYHHSMFERRFGSWTNACKQAGVPVSKKPQPKVVEMVTTTCVVCDARMERPKADRSCRRCKTCTPLKRSVPDLSDGYLFA